ncbi:MAG: hypothetical protein ABJC04_07765, partial [Verrucomicrobiota bacterium]
MFTKNKIIKIILTTSCLCLGACQTPVQEQQRVLYNADFTNLEISKLKLTKDWSAQDGLRLKSKDWWWETATLNVGQQDYQLDADVDICTNGQGQGNGAGFIVRSSAGGSAVFYISQQLGGYLAQAELIGKKSQEARKIASAVSTNTEAKPTSFYISPTEGRRLTQEELSATRAVGLKHSVYALSKDKEVGVRHLRLVVKGNLANFYVDEQLVCVLDLKDYPEGEVGLYGHYQVLFKSFTVRALSPGV